MLPQSFGVVHSSCVSGIELYRKYYTDTTILSQKKWCFIPITIPQTYILPMN